MDESTDRKPTAEEEKYSYAGVMELQRLKDSLVRAERGVEDGPEDEAAGLELEIARKRLELFSAEHDSAGAFKHKKFGRKIQELFKPGPDGKPGIERGDDGELKLSESQADRRFMLVNMGELDRFNKEGGGHAAGDAALGKTAAAVEKAVTEALGLEAGAITSDYQIYRYDSNTFMVDIASMPLKEFGELVKKMQEAQPKVDNVKDPAPLTVRGLDLNNVIGLVNYIQAELPEGAKFELGDDAAREIVEVMKRGADWDLEVNKLYTRAKRVNDKIDAGDQDVPDFYTNYVKKSFQGTELATLEGFMKAKEEGRSHALVEEIALQTVERRFAAGRKVDDQIRELIDSIALTRTETVRQTPAERSARLHQRAIETEGMRILEKMREAMEAMEKLAAAPTSSEREAKLLALRAESARLDYQIEVAQRDKGTGLLERGVHYEDLEKGIGEGKDIATVFVDMGFLKYFDQMGGSDVGDTALKTAAAMMEQAVKDAGVKASVYRYGGDEFTLVVEGGADAANDVIAALKVLRESAAPVAAGEKSRSEYAPSQLVFNYGLANRKMLDDLFEIALREGKYTPEELADPEFMLNAKAELMTKAADVGIEYNKGYSRMKLLINLLREPAYESDPVRKKQVEAMVGFSNKAIFTELGGSIILDAIAGDPRVGDLEAEVAESRKVLEDMPPDDPGYPKLEADLKASEKKLDQAIDAEDEKIIDYVVARVDEVRVRESGEKTQLDRLLAAQVKIAFLSDRLKEMEGITSLQEHKITKYQAKLLRAEQEKQQVIDAHEQIGKKAA